MQELDPQPFQELFGSEPSDPAAPDVARWTELYKSLIAMMERHLEETRAFASRAPEPVQHYLSRENIAILEQEIEAFKTRLAHWATVGAPRE